MLASTEGRLASLDAYDAPASRAEAAGATGEEAAGAAGAASSEASFAASSAAPGEASREASAAALLSFDVNVEAFDATGGVESAAGGLDSVPRSSACCCLARTPMMAARPATATTAVTSGVLDRRARAGA